MDCSCELINRMELEKQQLSLENQRLQEKTKRMADGFYLAIQTLYDDNTQREFLMPPEPLYSGYSSISQQLFVELMQLRKRNVKDILGRELLTGGKVEALKFTEAQNAEKEEKNREEEQDKIDKSWTEYETENGTPYYYNLITKKITRQIPWIEYETENGERFYKNPITGSTTREK